MQSADSAQDTELDRTPAEQLQLHAVPPRRENACAASQVNQDSLSPGATWRYDGSHWLQRHSGSLCARGSEFKICLDFTFEWLPERSLHLYFSHQQRANHRRPFLHRPHSAHCDRLLECRSVRLVQAGRVPFSVTECCSLSVRCYAIHFVVDRCVYAPRSAFVTICAGSTPHGCRGLKLPKQYFLSYSPLPKLLKRRPRPTLQPRL